MTSQIEFLCPNCGKDLTFVEAEGRNYHINICIDSIPQPKTCKSEYKCPICQKSLNHYSITQRQQHCNRCSDKKEKESSPAAKSVLNHSKEKPPIPSKKVKVRTTTKKKEDTKVLPKKQESLHQFLQFEYKQSVMNGCNSLHFDDLEVISKGPTKRKKVKSKQSPILHWPMKCYLCGKDLSVQGWRLCFSHMHSCAKSKGLDEHQTNWFIQSWYAAVQSDDRYFKFNQDLHTHESDVYHDVLKTELVNITTPVMINKEQNCPSPAEYSKKRKLVASEICNHNRKSSIKGSQKSKTVLIDDSDEDFEETNPFVHNKCNRKLEKFSQKKSRNIEKEHGIQPNLYVSLEGRFPHPNTGIKQGNNTCEENVSLHIKNLEKDWRDQVKNLYRAKNVKQVLSHLEFVGEKLRSLFSVQSDLIRELQLIYGPLQGIHLARTGSLRGLPTQSSFGLEYDHIPNFVDCNEDRFCNTNESEFQPKIESSIKEYKTSELDSKTHLNPENPLWSMSKLPMCNQFSSLLCNDEPNLCITTHEYDYSHTSEGFENANKEGKRVPKFGERDYVFMTELFCRDEKEYFNTIQDRGINEDAMRFGQEPQVQDENCVELERSDSEDEKGENKGGLECEEEEEEEEEEEAEIVEGNGCQVSNQDYQDPPKTEAFIFSQLVQENFDNLPKFCTPGAGVAFLLDVIDAIQENDLSQDEIVSQASIETSNEIDDPLFWTPDSQPDVPFDISPHFSRHKETSSRKSNLQCELTLNSQSCDHVQSDRNVNDFSIDMSTTRGHPDSQSLKSNHCVDVVDLLSSSSDSCDKENSIVPCNYVDICNKEPCIIDDLSYTSNPKLSEQAQNHTTRDIESLRPFDNLESLSIQSRPNRNENPPNFESMALIKLKQLVLSLGLRPSTKSQMVEQLQDIWNTSKQSIVDRIQSQCQENCEDKYAEDFIVMRKFLCETRPDIYQRVLLLEPIRIDYFSEQLSNAGLKYSQESVRSFFRHYGISFLSPWR